MRECLNLGAGDKPQASTATEHWINLDMQERPGIDVVATVPPLPFEDESLDYILALQFFEHIANGEPIIELINECWRVLRPDGILHAETPYWQTEQHHQDPTHISTWNVEKWYYFTQTYAYLGYGIKVWSHVLTRRANGWMVVADLRK